LGEAEDMGDGANGGKVRQDYLNRYFPDGRNEMHAWAMSHVRGLAPSATHTPFGPEGLLGESDEDLLRLFSLHKQHQPIKSQAYEGKTEKCLNIKPADMTSGDRAKARTTLRLVLGDCADYTPWYFNRFTQRVEMEEVPDENNPNIQVAKCLHRKPSEAQKHKEVAADGGGCYCKTSANGLHDQLNEQFNNKADCDGAKTGPQGPVNCVGTNKNNQVCQDGSLWCQWGSIDRGNTADDADGILNKDIPEPTLEVQDCNDGLEQVWTWECDSFSFQHLDVGPRVMTAVEDDNTVLATPYYGKPKNKWTYKEVVRHSRCRTKRYKTMKFDGTLGNTISFKRMTGWPEKGMTVMFWMKGTRGTPFSYASDGVPAPPFQTQLALSINEATQNIVIDLFDTPFDTGRKSNKHKWEHVAVSYETQFGNLKLHIDGVQVFTKETFSLTQGDGNGQSFSDLSFVSGGCVMLGQKAKRPCRERIPETSFKGEMADFLIVKGQVTEKDLEEMMFKPVAPEYLASITEEDPKNKPDRDKLRLAYLTRQYGSQEMDMTYPPVCALVEEEESFDMSEDYWAQCCDDNSKCTAALPGNSNNCMMPGGSGRVHAVGDVHYKDMSNCYFDDQAVGAMTAVHMFDKFRSGWPLTIQYYPTPLQSGAPWGNPAKTVTYKGKSMHFPGYLSMVSGCAIQFGDERIAAGFGGWHYDVRRRGPGQVGRYSASSDYQKGDVHVKHTGHVTFKASGCNGASNCHESENFSGHVHNSQFYINMNDGLQVQCGPASFYMKVPRKLEGKFAGMLGSHHKSTPATVNGREFLVGANAGAVEHMNKLFDISGSYKNIKGSSSSATKMASRDYEHMVYGEPVPSLANPQDGAGGWCRGGYQYGNPNSAFNGNRPWKGITKMIYSWKADGINIPNLFGAVGDKMEQELWDQMTPTAGAMKNRPSGTKELAEKGCESLKKWKKNYDDCLFDFVTMGEKAVAMNRKVTADQQAGDSQTPTQTSVRDSSGGGWHGNWVGHPNWGCVDSFSAHMTKLYAEREKAKHRANKMAEMCICRHKYLSVCAFDHFMCIEKIVLDYSKSGQVDSERKLLM